MLEIIQGSFTSGAHEAVTEKIKSLVSSKTPSFLIVPEQHTLSAEKEMASILPPEAPLFFEASNFTRFANSVFRTLGGVARSHSDRTRRALVMWDTLAELSPALSVLSLRSGVSAGLVNKAIAALNEAESFGVGSEALSEASRLLLEKNARLSAKLSDLALVSALYKKLLLEKYGDSGDVLSALAEKLSESPEYLRGTKIFIEGFTSFTEPQYRLIGMLMARADVTVSVTLPKSAEEAFEFSETRLLKSRLKRLAARLGCEVKIRKLDGSFGVKSDYLSEAVKLLWRTGAALSEEPDGAIRIFEGKTPYEECFFVAEDIKRRVFEGARYSDFLIVARRAESYVGTLDDALKKSALPHFFAKPSPIGSFEATKHILSAVSTLASGFRREELISYMKSGFSGVSRGACDEFELYAETWQLDGKRFIDGEIWNMRPEGYTLRLAPDSDEKLLRINQTRKTVIEPLLSLKDKFDSSKTVRDFATALYEFIAQTKLHEKNLERSRELLRLGESEASEECEALFGIIIGALDTLVEASGDKEASAESFYERLVLVFGEAKIGRIPSYKDKITVGSADSIRIGAKHVYMIGTSRGEFPAIPKDAGFFGDKEKLALRELGIEMDSDSEYEYARELFYFSRVFASASESVTVVFSGTDFSFKAVGPSEAIERLSRISGGKLQATKISALPLDERIFSENAALTLSRDSKRLRTALSELGREDKLSKSESKVKNDSMILSPEIAHLMYPGDIYLTQTRIDKFIDCPLAYFCQYKLSLSENERAEFDARNIGSFIHSILETFFATVKKREAHVSEIDSSEREKIAELAAEAYLDSLGSDSARKGREKFSLERLKTLAHPVIEELCRELTDCRFEPSFFELAIEDNKKGSPSASCFPLDDGSSVRIFGSIDRVDTYKDGDDVYVRVIDYKTGAKEFSPSDLDEGRNLQMFLYLKSVIETSDEEFLAKVGVTGGGKLIPAGVIYVKTDVGDVKINHASEEDALAAFKKNQGREGMILNDERSISAMNKEYLPVSFKKDGAPTASSEKYLFSREEWSEMLEKIRASITKLSREMKGGSITARPMKNKRTSPCSYCSFKPICRNAK